MNQPIEYLLRNNLLVSMTPDYFLTHTTIERMIMSYYGFSETLDEENGIALWHNMTDGKLCFISERAGEPETESMADMAESYGCPVLNLFSDYAIAQDVVRDLGLSVSPVIWRNGSLTGLWRAERISFYNPWSREANGLLSGVNQPVWVESPNLLKAIYATACRVMGIGKLAFVHLPAGHEGSADILVTDFTHVDKYADQLDISLFRAPAIDKYITTSLPEEVRENAIESARIRARAMLVETKEAN